MTATSTIRADSEQGTPTPTIHPWLCAAMIATPLLWLAAEAFSPALKAGSAAQLAVIADHPTRWYWYTLLLVIGSMTGVPASIGLLQLGRTRMRRTATIGGVLLTLGFLGSIIDCADQFWAWQMVKAGADSRQMTALLDRFDSSAGTSLLFMVTGIGLLVGTVLLTTALARHPVVRPWLALAFGVGVFANVIAFSANSIPALAASYLFLLAGMGGIGVEMARRRRTPSHGVD